MATEVPLGGDQRPWRPLPGTENHGRLLRHHAGAGMAPAKDKEGLR